MIKIIYDETFTIVIEEGKVIEIEDNNTIIICTCTTLAIITLPLFVLAQHWPLLNSVFALSLVHLEVKDPSRSIFLHACMLCAEEPPLLRFECPWVHARCYTNCKEGIHSGALSRPRHYCHYYYTFLPSIVAHCYYALSFAFPFSSL